MKTLPGLLVLLTLFTPFFAFGAAYVPLVGDAFYSDVFDGESDYIALYDESGEEVAQFDSLKECTESIDSVSQECKLVTPGVGALIQSILTWSIGIASIMAVAMIVYHGFEYTMGAGNTGKTQKARAGITNAVGGLILLIASVFLLNFINPSLTNLDVAIDAVEVEHEYYVESTVHCYSSIRNGFTSPGQCFQSKELCDEHKRQQNLPPLKKFCEPKTEEIDIKEGCKSCEKIDPGISIDQDACAIEECLIDPRLASRLDGFFPEAQSAVPDLKVIDAFPSISQRQESRVDCLDNGECVILDSKNEPSYEEIARILSAGERNGMTIRYRYTSLPEKREARNWMRDNGYEQFAGSVRNSSGIDSYNEITDAYFLVEN